jgi:prophage regulatory protein
MDNGTFPRNIKLNDRCTGWRESAVQAWVNNPMFYSVLDHAR